MIQLPRVSHSNQSQEVFRRNYCFLYPLDVPDVSVTALSNQRTNGCSLGSIQWALQWVLSCNVPVKTGWRLQFLIFLLASKGAIYTRIEGIPRLLFVAADSGPTLRVCLLQAAMLFPVHSAPLKHHVHNRTSQQPPLASHIHIGKQNKRVDKPEIVRKTIGKDNVTKDNITMQKNNRTTPLLSNTITTPPIPSNLSNPYCVHTGRTIPVVMLGMGARRAARVILALHDCLYGTNVVSSFPFSILFSFTTSTQ